MRDVTDRKMQEQALDLARTAAEQADASKTRFLATMSHELRTPLNAIIGFSEMIVQEDVLMIDAARRKEYAQLINDSGQHLLSVVNGILDMSKMESGNFEISPEPFAPRAALINCCNLLALKARENGIDLVTRAPDDLPVMTGDPRAFKQIVLNLVANAIKFTERGGTVTVSAARRGIAAGAARHRHRRRHRGRRSEADRRSVLPGRQDLSAAARRHRPRAVDREKPGRAACRRDDRAEQARRRHHRDRRVAAGVHADGRAALKQYRHADAGVAIRNPGAIPSGEEKCLEKFLINDDMPRRRRGAKAAAMEAEAERGLVMRMLLHSPKDMVAGALAFAAVSAIIANALFLQAGRHPSPMFGTVTTMPAAASAPASPLPRPRPVEAAARAADPVPSEPRVVELKSADAKSMPSAKNAIR